MRGMNFKDRNPLYKWVIEKLKLQKVYFQDFAKMNFVYTVMSKRKLKWLVNEGLAKGWDDPRFPTIKGILRRGVQFEASRHFMVFQGASRKMCHIEGTNFVMLITKLLILKYHVTWLLIGQIKLKLSSYQMSPTPL